MFGLSLLARSIGSLLVAMLLILFTDAEARSQCVTARVPSENLAVDDYLLGVTSISLTDAWAVGAFADPSHTYSKTLAEHWNGSTWTAVRTPNVGDPTPNDSLWSVAAEDATDVWAVGLTYNASTRNYWPLAMHWNGSFWKIFNVPSPYPNVYLKSVSAVKGVEEAWAVASEQQNPFIERWQHGQWSISYTYPGSYPAYLSSISSPSLRSAWAVGQYTQPIGQTFESLALALHCGSL